MGGGRGLIPSCECGGFRWREGKTHTLRARAQVYCQNQRFPFRLHGCVARAQTIRRRR